MNLNDELKQAWESLSYDESRAFQAHLLGGLLQAIDTGRATKSVASKAIARAHAFAIRDPVTA